LELLTTPIVTILSIWHKSARLIFRVLENFCHKYANLVAPPTYGTTKCLVRCNLHPVT